MGKIKKFDKEKIKSFDSWDKVSKEIFSESELKKLKADAQKRSDIRNQISHDLSLIISKYMAQNNVGFNELVRKLNMSSATVAKLVKGDCNISVDTLAEVLELTGNMIHFTHL